MKIYLACPYSHPDPAVREERFRQVNRAAADLMRAGHHVFSPISHTHPIAEAGGPPLGWDYWEAYDRSLIEWAEELHVLRLDGWLASQGVQAEIRIAGELGKRVVMVAGCAEKERMALSGFASELVDILRAVLFDVAPFYGMDEHVTEETHDRINAVLAKIDGVDYVPLAERRRKQEEERQKERLAQELRQMFGRPCNAGQERTDGAQPERMWVGSQEICTLLRPVNASLLLGSEYEKSMLVTLYIGIVDASVRMGVRAVIDKMNEDENEKNTKLHEGDL